MTNEHEIQGKYLSDVFLIEFPAHVRIFEREGNQGPKRPQDYATFVHEYWHYLLNITTSVGYRDFALWHQLIPLFTRTLESLNGTSLGSSSTSDFASFMEEIVEMIFSYRGDGVQASLNNGIITDLTVDGDAIIEDSALTMRSIPIHLKRVKLPVTITTDKNETILTFYVLGNWAINESIANAVERMIFDDGKVPPISPYLILNRISSFYNHGIPLSHYEIASIGTLSYLSTDAAYSCILLFKRYCLLRETESISKSLQIIMNEFEAGFEQIRSTILEDLQSLVSIYRNREPMDKMMDLVSGKFTRYLNLRSKDLLFDLNPFSIDGNCDVKMLEELLFTKVLSCDIRQVMPGDENAPKKDLLRSFDLEEIDLSGNIVYSSYLMQVFQSLLHYFRSHWAIHSFNRSEIANDKCPYFTTCELDRRIHSAHNCEARPWLNFSRTEENCMYGTAIATLLGHVRIKKKLAN